MSFLRFFRPNTDNRKRSLLFRAFTALISIVLAASCVPTAATEEQPIIVHEQQAPYLEVTPALTVEPTRPVYAPGELVEYIVQSGDSLPALAVRFNTTENEIREANSILPQELTTLPPGLPMQIPIYYQPLWGSSFLILPDSLFINGPAQIGFDAAEFVKSQPGWFKNYTYYAGNKNQKGGELVEHVAKNFSISPRLLLALLEFQTGCLTQSEPMDEEIKYALGLESINHQDLYTQLVLAANTLNEGYYGWREGLITSLELSDGQLENGDPWLNAATFSLHYLLSKSLDPQVYALAVENTGFIQTYIKLFGDPWENVQDHIPGSLEQPELTLPFEAGKWWAYTGGPHTGWGDSLPYAAVDFAPPSVTSGCFSSEEWITAIAPGIITRTSPEGLILDLDGDGDERTGWVIFYMHLATRDMIKSGTIVNIGDHLGHPSCEGGRATGTHVHIARKYNGEWISADSVLAFNMEGWIAKNGDQAYDGYLTRFSSIVRASESSEKESQIQSETEITGQDPD